MARNSAEACNTLDQSIPQWMRELLIRRRALGRTLQVGSSSVKLTCPAVVAVVRQPEIFGNCENVASRDQLDDELVSTSSSLEEPLPSPNLSIDSVGKSACNMRLLDKNCVVINGGDVRNKQSDMCVSESIIMVEDKKVNLKKISATSRARPKLTRNTSPSTNNKTSQGSDKMNGTLSMDDDYLSDSSEELQYGPGIVKRLKTKYLSMTLREQKKKSRPSIINLRRATSLENMLEVDGDVNNLEQKPSDTTIKTENKPSDGNNKIVYASKLVGQNSNRATKYLGNRSLETMKRARSMDTLLKTDLGQNTFKENIVPSNKNKHISKTEPTSPLKPIVSIVNENIIIVESVPVRNENTKLDHPCDNVQNSSSGGPIIRSLSCDSQDKELPPPDLVKQTLKIFEPSAKRKTKATNGSLSKLVVGVSAVSSQPSTGRSVNSIRSVDKIKMNPNKPSISPKPVISPEKLRQHRSRVGSPKKNQIGPNLSMDTKPLLSEHHPSFTKMNSGNAFSHQSSIIEASKVNKNGALQTPIEDDSPSIVSVTNSLNNKSLNPPVSNVFPTSSDHLLPHSLQRRNICNISPLEEKDDSLEYDESNRPVCESSKPVLESALENIRKGGFSMQFSFNNETSQNTSVPKTYLPISKTPPQALNSSLLKQKLNSSPPGIAPLRISSSPTGTKQIGIIRPLVSTKNQSSPPVLTDQEIEKNLINRVKSIEQPISKVVVAIKALPDSVVLGSVPDSGINKNNSSLQRVTAISKPKGQGLWDEEKIWQNNQNTIVFNFSDRKEVPDYIENDGIIIRGKREKPRPGEGGIILLEGADTREESCTDIEDFITTEPPSPCDVTFLNDNVLINGKSNLQKSPKQVKLRIKFNDDATTMFEYPSEASMVEDEPTASAESADEVDQNSEGASSCQPPSTSSAALPGSMHLGVPPPDYLPPPIPVKTVRASARLPVELTVKARAPQPPALRPPVPARSPLRRSPSDPGTLPRKTEPQAVKLIPEPPLLQDSLVKPYVSKKQKYFSKKKSRPCETNTLQHLTQDLSNENKKHESIDLQETSKNVSSMSGNTSSNYSEANKSISLPTLQHKTEYKTNCGSEQSSETFKKEIPFKSSVDLLTEEKKTSVVQLSNHALTNSSAHKTQLFDVPTTVQEVFPFKPQPTNLKTVSGLSYNQKQLKGLPSSPTSPVPLTRRDFQGNEPTQLNVKIESPMVKRHLVPNTPLSLKVAAVVESKPSPSRRTSFTRETHVPPQTLPTKTNVESLQTSSLPYLQTSSSLGSSDPKSTPVYSPVYSKHQFRIKSCTSSSELRVNPLLSPSLCKKPYLGGSLGAYTPRKMGAGDWQLGVTPVTAPATPAHASTPLTSPDEEDYLKPTPPESTVAWSEGTASDLLF